MIDYTLCPKIVVIPALGDRVRRTDTSCSRWSQGNISRYSLKENTPKITSSSTTVEIRQLYLKIIQEAKPREFGKNPVNGIHLKFPNF